MYNDEFFKARDIKHKNHWRHNVESTVFGATHIQIVQRTLLNKQSNNNKNEAKIQQQISAFKRVCSWGDILPYVSCSVLHESLSFVWATDLKKKHKKTNSFAMQTSNMKIMCATILDLLSIQNLFGRTFTQIVQPAIALTQKRYRRQSKRLNETEHGIQSFILSTTWNNIKLLK